MKPRGVNEQPINYEDRVSLWARRRQEARIMDKNLVKIALETGADLPAVSTAAIAKLPGDERALRGIPVVGVRNGVGGAIGGTKPGQWL